ncbi:MAG: hypothetical protein U9Q07_04760, partial [Planctomycetota bacterium]|nr:hypothetical protein [Planctomycetota bacterium]
YAADDEEIHECKSLSTEVDTTEDMVVFLGGYLDTANTSKKFKLQVSWTIDDMTDEATPLTDATTDVEVETTTGTAAQYAPFKIAFAIASVAASADNGNKLGIRIRRIAASADEIAGETVICGAALRFIKNKQGSDI